MPDLKTTGLTLATLISLLIAGVVAYNASNVYYCAPRDLAYQCDKLSSSGKTCYIGNTSKVCTIAWIKLNLSSYGPTETEGNQTNVIIKDGRDWYCTGLNPTDMCYFGARQPVTYGSLK